MRDVNAIGGYFELDAGIGQSSLPNGALLNSGRNALRHIVRMLGIQHIHVPYYICPVVIDAIEIEGCAVERYALTNDMMPDKTFPKDDYVLYVNYFGVCGRNVDGLASQYPNLIVDCAQAYFATPKGCASFSSPRKFFGIPDGGVAYGVGSGDYSEDVSDVRMWHLIERKKNGATSRGYELFRASEASLCEMAVLGMSSLTRDCLARVDLSNARNQRLSNFNYLQRCLPTSFPFALAEDDVPMVYPFMTDSQDLRARLIQERIYVASYWPGVSHCGNLQNRILPLPIDQRYGEKEMIHMIEIICSCLGKYR